MFQVKKRHENWIKIKKNMGSRKRLEMSCTISMTMTRGNICWWKRVLQSATVKGELVMWTLYSSCCTWMFLDSCSGKDLLIFREATAIRSG